jgi:hypothetical protein
MDYFGIVTEQQSFGPLQYIKAPSNYFTATWHVLTYGNNAPYYEGKYEIIKWITVGPIYAGIVFGLIIIFFNVFFKQV